MAFLDAFRFSFKSNPTTWLYWNNGSFGTSTTARYLYAPNNWQGTGIKWVRSFDKRGLIRTNTLDYQFIRDAASILRSEYYGGSIEERVYFLVERMNIDTTAYETYLEGEIDLSTFEDGTLYNVSSKGVSAKVIEGGITAALDANENIPYEIALDPASSDQIKMDGTVLTNNYRYGMLTDTTTSGAFFATGRSVALPLFFVGKEAEYTNGLSNSATFISMDGPVTAGPTHTFPTYGSTEQNNYMYEAQTDSTIKVTAKVDLQAQFTNNSLSVGFLAIRLLIWDDSAATWADSIIFQDTVNGVSPSGTSPLIHALGSTSVSLSDKDRLYVVINATDATGVQILDADYDVTGNDNAINLYIEFKLPDTYTYSKPYRTVVSELLEKITGIPGVLQSNLLTYAGGSYYDSYPFNLRVTCGDALRNLAGNAVQAIDQSPVYPKIRVTWGDVWKDLRCRLGVGMAVRNGKVIIERADGFFNKNTVIANLGEVKSMSVKPATEYFSTSQKWGYPIQNYDKLNGRDEPNTTSVWKMPTTRVQKEEDNICPFRSDMYGIEYTRANLIGKKTTDSKSDNETFVIETEATPVPILILIGGMYVPVGYAYNLYRPQNSYTQPADTGLLFPTTAYNLTQTGKRNLLRSGPMVRLSLKGLDNEYITYQTSDKNSELSINCGVGIITEKDPIKVSDLPAAIGQPSLLHIEHVTSLAIKAALDNNPDGCFTFTENGKTYKGFPMEIGVKAGVVDTYQTTLLATPDCDLLQKVE